eukprot:1157268-Pelagomonas_calceolata.AAC.1
MPATSLRLERYREGQHCPIVDTKHPPRRRPAPEHSEVALAPDLHFGPGPDHSQGAPPSPTGSELHMRKGLQSRRLTTSRFQPTTNN